MVVLPLPAGKLRVSSALSMDPLYQELGPFPRLTKCSCAHYRHCLQEPKIGDPERVTRSWWKCPGPKDTWSLFSEWFVCELAPRDCCILLPLLSSGLTQSPSLTVNCGLSVCSFSLIDVFTPWEIGALSGYRGDW